MEQTPQSKSDLFRKRPAQTPQSPTTPQTPTPPQPEAAQVEPVQPVKKKDGNNNTALIVGIIAIAVVVGIIIAIALGKKSNSDSYEWVSDEVPADSVVIVEAVQAASYLRVSEDDLEFDADGGSTQISIYTDGEWEVSIGTASWADLTQMSEGLLLAVNENQSGDERTDWFELKADDITKRINIKQAGAKPSVVLDRVWVDHSVYSDNRKGMKIHCQLTVKGLKNRTIYPTIKFYKSDNCTAVRDTYNDPLMVSTSRTPSNNSQTYDDIALFVPYSSFNLGYGYGSIDLSFDVIVTDSSDNRYVLDENHTFTMNEG